MRFDDVWIWVVVCVGGCVIVLRRCCYSVYLVYLLDFVDIIKLVLVRGLVLYYFDISYWGVRGGRGVVFYFFFVVFRWFFVLG